MNDSFKEDTTNKIDAMEEKMYNKEIKESIRKALEKKPDCPKEFDNIKMNEKEFINQLKRSNVILIDELYNLYISKREFKEIIDRLKPKRDGSVFIKEDIEMYTGPPYSFSESAAIFILLEIERRLDNLKQWV